jgi:hypothetical protein
MTRYRLREGLTIRPLPEGDAVVATSEGATAVIVNSTGHAILDLLSEARTEDEIGDLLCGTFPDQEVSAVRRDISALVAELAQAGIVEPCGGERSTV